MKRLGRDISLIATSSMVHVALGAKAVLLEAVGIAAEVIGSADSLASSTSKPCWPRRKKPPRVIVIDEGYERYGVTAEIASVIATGAFMAIWKRPSSAWGPCTCPSLFLLPLKMRLRAH